MNSLIQAFKSLDEKELEKVNSFIDTLDFLPNTVFQGENSPDVDESVRTSVGCNLENDHEITGLLHEKMNAALDEYKERLLKVNDIFGYYPVAGGVDTQSHREDIQILSYTKGKHYKFHHDASDNVKEKEFYRTVSVIMYLKSAEEGGGTLFPHQSFYPEAGETLVFPSNWCYPHSGEKIIKGEKRVAVTWYYVELDSVPRSSELSAPTSVWGGTLDT